MMEPKDQAEEYIFQHMKAGLSRPEAIEAAKVTCEMVQGLLEFSIEAKFIEYFIYFTLVRKALDEIK